MLDTSVLVAAERGTSALDAFLDAHADVRPVIAAITASELGYRMTLAERWAESERLWATYLSLGGSLDPEPDTESPFHDPHEPVPGSRTVQLPLRVERRSGV